jgi:hypothetical protein
MHTRVSALGCHPPLLPSLARNASRAFSGSCRLRSEVNTSWSRPVALCHLLGACPSADEVQASGSRPYGLITQLLSAQGESGRRRRFPTVPDQTGSYGEPESAPTNNHTMWQLLSWRTIFALCYFVESTSVHR